MIAVIFEFEPNDNARETYLETTAAMRSLLDTIDGFISIERFESLTTPGKILSLSFFRDETAVRAWRNLPQHRKAQALGRSRLFREYRLRVAEVLRDYTRDDRAEAPEDSLAIHG
ncbi:MAG: antibiotic biosynthesis monooxygenase [Azospirillaceae bacterium]